jgi:hypothetical protein
LTAQSETRQAAARAQWETESETRTRAAIEPLRATLVRAEKERDEARLASSEHARQVQSMEKKLAEASAFFNTWRNGKNMVGAS